jgi:CRISPR-associated protein Cas2
MALGHVLLIYDVTDDRARTRIATACEDYGLDRIQYSAFYGLLTRNLQEELMLKVQALLGKHTGCVQLIPIANSEWERRIEVSNAG